MKKAILGIMVLLFTVMVTSNIVFSVASSAPVPVFFDDFNDGIADGWTEHLGTWGCY
jgi:hypothetical protein